MGCALAQGIHPPFFSNQRGYSLKCKGVLAELGKFYLVLHITDEKDLGLVNKAYLSMQLDNGYRVQCAGLEDMVCLTLVGNSSCKTQTILWCFLQLP